MEDLIVRFTLECRTNNSGKLKRFKPNNINRENYCNRAKRVIKEVEDELSFDKDLD